MDANQLKLIIEAALLTAAEPLTLDRLERLFVEEFIPPTRPQIRQAIETLQQEQQDKSYELKELASGYCFRVKQEYGQWMVKLWEEKPPRYSRTVLETLALIAYRQPLTRAEIEMVRGVSVSSQVIRTLQDRGWIRVVGQRDLPGKPSLYATTKAFLDYFNLKSLEELPPLSEIKDLALAEEKLNEHFQSEQFQIEIEGTIVETTLLN